MLSHEYGQKVAVIVNEVGEVGIDHQIDHQLVVNTDAEIFEMNNGYICCTGRSDLIPMIGNLMNGSTSLITWSLKRRGWQILRP
ncbi:hypothetical protein NIES2134_113890 [Thermostichus vulcanus NIES-2134]|nr:hypothetical protein NIES2134_113890 [Thermostichus vulcanus NIES-2134]